ncbi:MAG: glycosyltransferase family A protein [Candidatus Omnitrophota bacterium]|jgi:chlorobactene glucosyltransferase
MFPIPQPLIDQRLFILIAMLVVWAGRARRATRTRLKVRNLDPKTVKAPVREKVSVIVPARNEEKNIGECLEGLLHQDAADLEIIVADDNSTDETAEILKSFSDRVRVVQVPPTPRGWTGKNFAVHTAVAHATGDWYLFTDADTRHESSSVSCALAHASARAVELLTLLPRCIARGFVEKLIQPTAMGFLGLWFPFEKVNQPKSREVFGNGQFLLIRRELYGRLGGHEAVRQEFLEDYALVRKAKAAGAKIECAFGIRLYGTRMYDSFTAIWRGWRRIYLHAFEQKPLTLALRALSVLFFSVVPFLALIPLAISAYVKHSQIAQGLLAAEASLLLLIWIIAWQTYGLIRAQRLYALLHPLAAVVVGMILLDASIMAATKQETKWR